METTKGKKEISNLQFILQDQISKSGSPSLETPDNVSDPTNAFFLIFWRLVVFISANLPMCGLKITKILKFSFENQYNLSLC